MTVHAFLVISEPFGAFQSRFEPQEARLLFHLLLQQGLLLDIAHLHTRSFFPPRF